MNAAMDAAQWRWAAQTLASLSTLGLQGDALSATACLASPWRSALAVLRALPCVALQPDDLAGTAVLTTLADGLRWRQALAARQLYPVAADVLACGALAGACEGQPATPALLAMAFEASVRMLRAARLQKMGARRRRGHVALGPRAPCAVLPPSAQAHGRS